MFTFVLVFVSSRLRYELELGHHPFRWAVLRNLLTSNSSLINTLVSSPLSLSIKFLVLFSPF